MTETLSAFPAGDAQAERGVKLDELLAQPDGLDRLVALVTNRIINDAPSRKRFFEQAFQDRGMLLDLAEMVQADAALHLDFISLFGGSVLCNRLMWAAWDAHCWLLDPEPARTVQTLEARAPYKNEGVAIKLDPVIYFRPKGVVVDLYDDCNVLEKIRDWPTRTLDEDPRHPNNLILPRQSFVGTAGRLELPADCRCPLGAMVLTRSSHARMSNWSLTPDCPWLKNGHRGLIYVEPENGSDEPARLKPGMDIGMLFLWAISGRPIPYTSQYHGQ